jgi:hypothetical protein
VLTIEGNYPHSQRKESAHKEQTLAKVPLGGPYKAFLDLDKNRKATRLRLRTHL